MKKRLLPCLAVLFLLLTACGGGHMGVHALEDITDADIVANEMGYSAGLWQSYSDTFSCEASWESFRGVEYLWTLPGNEARTVHVTYAEQECGDYRVVLVLPDDTVVELEEGENTVEVPEGSTWMAVAAAGGGFTLHSDRGWHYRTPDWVRACGEAGVERSMSRKGHSPDNAACEGFFGRLKVEFFHGRDWRGVSAERFAAELAEWIRWYREGRLKAFDEGGRKVYDTIAGRRRRLGLAA